MAGERSSVAGARAAVRVCLTTVALLAGASQPALAVNVSGQPAPGPPVVVDGPSASLVSLSGMSIAHDGTGGLVYLKQVAGVAHVFVARLAGGLFQPPQQVDAAFSSPSSQPVIAAGNNGVLLIAFVNAGTLYVVDRPGTSAAYRAPAVIAAAATNPAIGMSNFGKGYLAFAVAAPGGGSDVRAAYYYAGKWALESAPLNAVPGDDAGTGSGRPRVAAAGDGVGIVAWGETGHVYTRRVWATSPSVVDEQADVPLPGCSEVSADEPVIGSGGDSSYAGVVFRETLACGSPAATRVLINRLHGSVYDGVRAVDGLPTPPPEGADEPGVAVSEYGRGFATAARVTSNQLFAMNLGSNAAPGSVFRVDATLNDAPPYAAPALCGLNSYFVAWQQSPGTSGPAEIRVRYADNTGVFGAELVVSGAGASTDAARGLSAAGDTGGDAAIAWIQGNGSSTELMTAQLYQPPGSARATKNFAYARTARPTLSWRAPSERWGPLRYVVTVDGRQTGSSSTTSLRVSSPLRDGPHSWVVTAVNRGGLTGTSRAATVFVDTVAPHGRIALSRRPLAGAAVRLGLRYGDPRPSSGLAAITIEWGDGTLMSLAPGAHRAPHVYTRPGRYKLKVSLLDRAGNTTTLVRVVHVAGATTPPTRKKHA